MAKRNIKFDLDFEQKDILSKFSIKQFDNALINISTYSEGKELNPVGNTCKLYVSVGNEVFLQNNGIRVLENTIEIDLDKNIVSSHGKALGELELTDSNGVFTSTTFIFDIDSKVGEGSTLPNGVEGFITKHERLIREFKNEINPKVEKLQSDINKSNNEINVINSELKQIERKNIEQDTRLKDVEYKNKVQDTYISGLFNENNDKRLTIEGEGNSLKLEGSKEGLVEVEKIVGNTLVNLCPHRSLSFSKTDETKYALKELQCPLIKANTTYTIIGNLKNNPNIVENKVAIFFSLDGYNGSHSITFYTSTKGLIKQVISTKVVSETNATIYNLRLASVVGGSVGDYLLDDIIILEGDYTDKPIPSEYFEGMQSTFEECKVTQEMVDSGEELEENLGKYKCLAKVRGKNLQTSQNYFERTQTVYLNSPLLKGDGIVCKEDGLYHWHKMKQDVLDGSEDENWTKNPMPNQDSSVYITCSLKPNDYNSVVGICDKLPIVANSTQLSSNKSIFFGQSINITLLVSEVGSTVEEFKAYLKANPLTVVYELAEPYYEKISDDKLLLEIPNNATLSVESVIPCTSISATYTGGIPSLYGMENSILDIEEHNVDMVATTFDMDYRLLEVEWALEDAGLVGISLASTFNSNRKGEKTMALSRYEQAKIMILGGAYDKATLTKQLTRYLEKNIITKEEYDELLALMEAKELVTGE